MRNKIFLVVLLLLSIATTLTASEQYRRHRYNQFKGLSVNSNSIVFVGNSITDMQNWTEAFGNDPRVVSRGVSGGFSFEVRDNVYNWVYGHPAKVFIKIGTNDLNGYGNPQSISSNIEKTLSIVAAESPNTEVYIQSILPCQNGNRSDADIRQTNSMLQTICDKFPKATYIDLYSQMGAVKNGLPYGCPDRLHVAGAGYAVWCNAIAKYVGIETVYPDGATTASIQNVYGMNDVHGGRTSCFSVQPTKADDIIFIGDGMVQSGEWNELLSGAVVKNHGTGWEVNSGSIAVTSNMIDATLKANGSIVKQTPKAILLYTGSTSFNANDYEALITKIRSYSTSIKIYCVNLQPKATNASAVNPQIETICAKYNDVKLIDIYTELNKHVSEADYFTENLPYYLSYVTIAQQIAAQAPELGLTALTIEQARHNKAVCDATEMVYTVNAGTGIGQYPSQKVNELKAALNGTTEQINAAVAALKASLNMPTEANVADKQFTLSTPNRSGRYALATSATNMACAASSTGQASYRWIFESRGDGSYNIKNASTNTYVNPASTSNQAMTLVASIPNVGWTFAPSDAAGLYIIKSGSSQFNMSNNSNMIIYNWGGGNNTSDLGCQWLIDDVTDVPVTPDPEPAAPGSYVVDKTNGALSGGSTWNSKWTSTDGVLTLTSNANNMQWNSNNIDARSGTAKSSTYTLAVTAGKEIVSYSFKAKALTANAQTWTQDGKTYNVTNSGETVISGTDVNSQSVVFTLTGENQGTLLTEFTVTTRDRQAQTEPNIEFSTDAEQHWYYIYSTANNDYAKGKVWYYDAAADRMKFGNRTFMAEYVWSFWKNAQGKIAIKNYNGVYVGTAGSGTGGSTQFGKAASANYIYQIDNIADGQFTISDGGTPLHAQDAGSVLVRWAAEANNASTWNFQKVDVSNAQASIASTNVQQGKVTTGIGNKNCAILRSTLTVAGLTGTVNVQGVKGAVVATDKSNVTAIRAYFAKNAQELFIDDAKTMTWREENGELFGEGTIDGSGNYTITGSKTLAPGTYYLWIAMDIADNAKEGNTVDATITGYTVDSKNVAESNGNPQFAATIFLSESSVLMPMDKGSLYYRIPAICTSADGKRLVVLTDDRKNHNGDLPSHCYVVAQYSEDNGKTWTDPITVAGTSTTGGDYGHGDASLITNHINGDIIGIMTTSANGNGYFGSTPQKPQTWKTIVSHDGGKTWETPVDHTKDLYGAGSPNPNWLGGFSGSGAGLQKRDGTLVSPFVNRESPDGTNNNVTQNYYSFMSKDGGKTWYVSGTSGTKACDEPKILERNNGDLSISVRAGGYNYHNVTSDDGETWKYASQTRFTSGISGNACDGDYMVWCSTLDGNPWNIALQTAPNSGSRENVSIALSTDEGETFSIVKTVCPRGSAYSSTTIMPDGTCGMYYEENGLFGGYTMRFVRFSLDWASNGTYKFTEAQPFHPIQIGTPTAIDDVQSTATQSDNVIYDLSGRPVQSVSARGVFIKNGNKVMF